MPLVANEEIITKCFAIPIIKKLALANSMLNSKVNIAYHSLGENVVTNITRIEGWKMYVSLKKFFSNNKLIVLFDSFRTVFVMFFYSSFIILYVYSFNSYCPNIWTLWICNNTCRVFSQFQVIQKWVIESIWVSPFQPSVALLYHLKTSENLNIF